MTRTSLVRYYRTIEPWQRYTTEGTARVRELAERFQENRKYFGKRVLDLACGGGVISSVIEPTGRTYVGIDLNPDMIRAARSSARDRGSRAVFILGDVTQIRAPGRFDTIVLLGNALCHVSTFQMLELLEHLRPHVHRGSTFLVEYQDMVGMFWRGYWANHPFVWRHHSGGTVTSRTVAVDLEDGVVRIAATPSRGTWRVNLDHALWSPFVLEPLMAAHGWKLVKREKGAAPPEGKPDPDPWFELYRFASR